MYNDEYPTCQECYATLCVYDAPGELVSQTLGVTATRQQGPDDDKPTRLRGWFLSSKDSVQSKDGRRHLDWVLDQLVDKADALDELRRSGARIAISVFWVSGHGHGGPTLSPAQAAKLSTLNLEMWFDVYFAGASE